MKKLLLKLAIVCSITAFGQKEMPKDYVKLSGQIASQNSDSLVLGQRGIIKTMQVNSSGVFSDTLKVEPGLYVLFDGSQQARVYLKNGYDLKVSLDGKNFEKSINFEGNGSNTNNYLAEKNLLEQRLMNYDSIMSLKKPDFEIKMQNIKGKMYSLLNEAKDLETSFMAAEKADIEQMVHDIASSYQEKQALRAFDGKPSPKFSGYENFKGGTLSLDDLKGKYVYIDLWATWCAPCKAEIPYLIDLEKKYRGKNIEFLSISIDKKSAYEKWRKLVSEKELAGIQLYAHEDKSFMEAYKVTGIPRFILIDPKGLIISADAPRPSDKALIELLSELKI